MAELRVASGHRERHGHIYKGLLLLLLGIDGNPNLLMGRILSIITCNNEANELRSSVQFTSASIQHCTATGNIQASSLQVNKVDKPSCYVENVTPNS